MRVCREGFFFSFAVECGTPSKSKPVTRNSVSWSTFLRANPIAILTRSAEMHRPRSHDWLTMTSLVTPPVQSHPRLLDLTSFVPFVALQSRSLARSTVRSFRYALFVHRLGVVPSPGSALGEASGCCGRRVGHRDEANPLSDNRSE